MRQEAVKQKTNQYYEETKLLIDKKSHMDTWLSEHELELNQVCIVFNWFFLFWKFYIHVFSSFGSEVSPIQNAIARRIRGNIQSDQR